MCLSERCAERRDRLKRRDTERGRWSESKAEEGSQPAVGIV